MEELRIAFQAWSDNIRQKKEQEEKRIVKSKWLRLVLERFPLHDEDEDDTICNHPVEEIDIFTGSDDSIPPGIKSDDYDSESDDNSTSLPEFESFHVDYPDSGDSTIDVVEDIPVDVPNILPTHPTLHMDFDFIPSHNDLGSILEYTFSLFADRNQDFTTRIAPDFESSRARSFVLCSLELHILSFIMGIQYPILSTNVYLYAYLILIVPAVVVFTYRIFTEGQKLSQNRARERKEHEKVKVKVKVNQKVKMSKVPNTEDMIKFMLDTKEFTYTMDMFRVTLHLLVKTPKNPFVAPVNIQTIEAFMYRVGYQDVVDKDDTLLVSVYTTRNVLVRGMLISDAFLTEEIRATDDFKEYETVSIDDDDFEDRLEPESHKENPEYVDDDVDEEKVDEEKDVDTGRCADVKVDRVLHEIVLQLAEKATDDLIENNLKPSIVATIIEDRDAFHLELPDLVSPEFNAQAPKTIKELFKNYIKLMISLCRSSGNQNDKFKKSSTSNTSCRDDNIHSQRHDDHQEDDAPPDEEKRVKRHKASESLKFERGSSSKHSAKDFITYVSKQQQHEWDAWVEETVIDDDEVILEDETPELITKLQNVDKHVPTIFDRARMEATLNDMLINQFKNAKELAYHLEQSTNFMEEIV
ncbi:hypothetical protein Tco_1302683 [Tanacetum coccineum]